MYYKIYCLLVSLEQQYLASIRVGIICYVGVVTLWLLFFRLYEGILATVRIEYVASLVILRASLSAIFHLNYYKQ